MELSPLAPVGAKISSLRKRGATEIEGIIGSKALEGRKRRNKMNENLSVLQSLLPSLPSSSSKVTKEQVVSGSIDLIKRLEDEKSRLEENIKRIQLEDMEKPVLASSVANQAFSNGVVFFVIRTQAKRGLLCNALSIFEKHQAEVLVANVSVDDHKLLTLAVTVKVLCGTAKEVEDIRRELQSL